MTDVIDAVADEAELFAWGPPRGVKRLSPRRAGKVAARPRRLLLVAFVVGLAFDVSVRQVVPGLGWVLWCSAVVVGLGLVVARLRRPALLALLAAALFVPWFMVRSSPWLLAPDALAFAALVGYAADLSAGGPVRRSVTGLCRVAVSAAEAAYEALPFVARSGMAVTARLRRRQVPWRRVGRALAIALPVVVLLFVLLATGDALFASTFDPGTSSGLDHLLFVAIGAVLFAVLATMATAPSRALVVTRATRLRTLDAMVVLGGVAALFAAYAFVQLSALLSGGAYVRRKTGLTYAEYARSGFFQLMAAAAISFVVLCAVRPTVQSAVSGRRSLRWLVAAVVALTQVLVIGSIVRIRLYSNVFGLTHLRLYTVVSALWLGIVVVLAGVAAIRRGRGDWMAVTASAMAALAVLAMNFVNPDRLVAQENIGRVDVSQARFDGSYLSTLSADAVPWIVAHLDEVPADQRAALLEQLCVKDFDHLSVFAWNAAEVAAADALNSVCT